MVVVNVPCYLPLNSVLPHGTLHLLLQSASNTDVNSSGCIVHTLLLALLMCRHLLCHYHTGQPSRTSRRVHRAHLGRYRSPGQARVQLLHRAGARNGRGHSGQYPLRGVLSVPVGKQELCALHTGQGGGPGGQALAGTVSSLGPVSAPSLCGRACEKFLWCGCLLFCTTGLLESSQ
jgi:hypothetical protein